MKKYIKYFPLVIVIIIIGILALQLFNANGNKQNTIYTKNNIPNISAKLFNSDNIFNIESLHGKKYIINFFASWCYSCTIENDFLKLLREKNIPIIGIAWKDNPDNLNNWFEKYGNHYDYVIMDNESDILINFGIRNIPETFLVNEEGIIIKNIKGPITQENIAEITELI